MITLTNKIDMRPGVVPLVIHLGQYDSDFSLVFELYSSAGNFTVESDTTAMIRGTKTDGNAYDADATINISAKTVTVAGSEQMTAAKGRNVYELVLTKSGKVLSTANFILDVERAAMDADTIASESVLKELNAIIAGAETATEAAADAASAADRAEDAADSVSSASAQIATNTADISDLKADLTQIFSDEAKQALITCFENVGWKNGDGRDFIDALNDALYPSSYPKITATINQSGEVFDTDDINVIRQYLTVTYYQSEEDAGTVVTDYTLTGTLSIGTSIITISYNGVRTTVNVHVDSFYFEPSLVVGTVAANSTSISYNANSARACNNPIAVKLPVGLYELDNTVAGSDYYYAITAYSYDDEQYPVDWSFTEGTAKTFVQSANIPYTIKWSLYVDGSSGWTNTNGKQIRVTEQDTVVAFNVKKYSAGTENISQNDLETLNNGGIVLRRVSA